MLARVIEKGLIVMNRAKSLRIIATYVEKKESK